MKEEAIHKLLDHIETISGERPDCAPLPEVDALTLPLYLRGRWEFYRARLFGGKMILAVESSTWERGSPKEYREQWDVLREKLGERVVLVLRSLPSYTRNRIISAGVEFIIPGSQIFLLPSVIDLRERFVGGATRRAPEKLSPASQLLVLFHLQRRSLDGLALKEIAKQLEYSTMTLSKTKDELEACALVKVERVGRSIMLDFPPKQELWKQALSLLSSPVRDVSWVQVDVTDNSAPLAGMTALAQLTMIEDDRLPTYAVAQLNSANRFLRLFRTCQDADEANARFETWIYNPLLLAENNIVDPLSLYLSLRDSADERVQGQLNHMMEELKWSED